MPPRSTPTATAAASASSVRHLPRSPARSAANAASAIAFHHTACGNPIRKADPMTSATATKASRRVRRPSSTISTSAAPSSHGRCATTATMLT